MNPDYVPLWVKSNFSFLEGASHPYELVSQAHTMGLSTLPLTDRDGVYGIVQAHMQAQETGTKLIFGSEVTVQQRGGTTSVVLFAENRTGYANLCQLISKGRGRCEKGRSEITVEELCEAGPHLVALCHDPILLPFLEAAYRGRLYALCARHRDFQEQPKEHALREAAKACAIHTVATNEVLYHVASRRPLQDVLSCIKHGVTLSNCGGYTRPNAEHDLKTPYAMARLFEDDPQSLRRTLEVAERCNFTLSSLRYRYPVEDIPGEHSESDWLRELTYRGAQTRFPEGVPEDVRAQIERELELIHELDYGGYFLTMHDIVKFCRGEDILCQGRGSAANSVVCYCLGITAIDPVKLDLLFERFLSRERAEPPDIDLDIEHNRREEVIQWVYERYGRKKAAMVANVIRYRTRSAIREVGKALAMPATALDRLSKLLGGRFTEIDHEALTYAGLDAQAPVQEHFLKLITEIQDFPRHLSIHPGGFLLGHEPVDSIVPIEPASMEDRTVIQWDKYAIDDLGLFKVDLLGVGALTQAHGCFDLMQEHYGHTLDFRSVPPDDPDTYAMIQKGDTVGVFQIESRAQMSMLPRLKPKKFYDLVVEVAIVRPGPIQGDMVHPYLKRRNGEEQPEYPHPALERALAKTLGVPIFQEQVMKVAVLVGGYTPGEADQLRRDMAAWRRSGRIERHHERLVTRMTENGIEPEFAERIFSQIRGFGEYGFPESHAASFALIAYVTAWQRCHYPAAFVCSLLNALPMGFYSPSTLVEDAKRHGVVVYPIDVTRSSWDCTLEKLDPQEDRAGHGYALRMGLRFIKGLSETALEKAPGPYPNIEDFIRRSRLPLNMLIRLAESGAFGGFGLSRRDAIWRVREIHPRRDDGLNLTSSDAPADNGPLFAKLRPAEEVFWDYRTSFHSSRGHPMESLRSRLEKQGLPDARALNALPDGSTTQFVGMAICRQRPGTATGVTFYTLEDETGFVNLVVWRQVFEKYSVIARTALLLGVSGKIQSESGVVHLIADSLWDPQMPFTTDGASVRSFH